jgi:hypothetical protein
MTTTAARGFIQVFPVNVSAYLVAAIASLGSAAPQRLWFALFASSWLISFVWWKNAGAAKSPRMGDAVAYATGAALGTISGLALTRWWVTFSH